MAAISERTPDFSHGMTTIGFCTGLYTFFTAFDFVAVFPGVSVGRITAILLLMVLLFECSKARVPKAKYVGAVFAFAFSCLAVLLLMRNPASGLPGLMSYALNIAVFILVVSLPLSSRDKIFCERMLVASALLMCVLMVTNPGSVGNEWATGRSVVNIFGSQQDPNQLCGYFIFAVAFCSYRAFAKGNFWLLLIVAFSFYAVLLTGSRGGLLANMSACVAGVFFGLSGTKHKMAYFAVVAGLFLLVALGVDEILSLLPPSVASRFSSLSLDSGAGSLRFEAWEDVLGAYLSSDLIHQLFGHGYGSTMQVTFNGLVAHNTFIEVLYSFGMLGFLAFSLLLLFALIAAFRKKNYALVAALVGFYLLIATLTDSSSKTLWVMLTLAFLDSDGEGVETTSGDGGR
ncbi:O-antigen ligase family protein [Slackia piriformis]